MADKWSTLDPSGTMDGTEITIFIPSGGGLQRRNTYTQIFLDMMPIWEGELAAGDTPDGTEIVAATPSGGGPQKRFAFQDIADLANLSRKTVLTGIANYYVSATGNDANDGSAADDAHAWATITYAYNWICQNVDQNGYAAYIIVGVGSFAGLDQNQFANFSGPIVIQGDSPATTTLVDGGPGGCIYLRNVSSYCTIYVSGVTLDATGIDLCVDASNSPAKLYLGLLPANTSGTVSFKGAGYALGYITSGRLILGGDVHIDVSSSLDFAFFAETSTDFTVTQATFTADNPFTFTNFLSVDTLSLVNFDSSSNTGTFTGAKYSAINGGVVKELNAGVPGSTAGTIETYTVAGLPSTPGIGRKAFVTDALVPVYGNTVANGGSAFTPVYYDGSNWIVG